MLRHSNLRTTDRETGATPVRAASLGRMGLRAMVCALALSSLTACEFMQYLGGGEGVFATAVQRREAASPESAYEGLRKEEIVAVQESLAELGYRPGPADGEIGARTERAIRAYQKQAGLPVDGQISQALIESIENNPVSAPPRPAVVAEGPEMAVDRPDSVDDVVVIPIPEDMVGSLLPPLYEAGDLFAWSDGHVDTVYRVSTDKVFWRTDGNASYNKDPNFMIPASSWDGASGPGSATVDIERDDAWPLRQGVDLAFTVTPTATPDRPVQWNCSVGGEEKVAVPAGEFDTRVFTCQREGAPAGEWTSRSWYYAPAVRHFVRRIDGFADGARRSVSLVAMRPSGRNWPSAARVGFEWAIQDALENQANGVAAEWGSTGVRDNFKIMPTKNHASTGAENGCRSFVLKRGEGDTQRTYPAIACRSDDSGRWLVPVLDKEAVPLASLQGTS